jgi:hypothetical protein
MFHDGPVAADPGHLLPGDGLFPAHLGITFMRRTGGGQDVDVE